MKVAFVIAAATAGVSAGLASAEDAASAAGVPKDKTNLRSPRLIAEAPRLRSDAGVTHNARRLSPGQGAGPNSDPKCPVVQKLGVIELDFNPAFTEADEDANCLFVSSFFNKQSAVSTLQPDLVARICDLDALEAAEDYASASPEVLITADPNPLVGEDVIWPNDMDKAPAGVFPFEALVVSQGFQPALDQGRLSVIDLETNTEYIIDQSTQTPGGYTGPVNPFNQPRFYHNVLFYDMDGDGLLDIITVRSGLRVGAGGNYPPSGELVWFKNPGGGLAPDAEWQETTLYGSVFAGTLMGPKAGPDIFVAMHDFDNDGVPEFVATHLFTGPDFFTFQGKITLYAAPEGEDWSVVNGADLGAPQARVKDLSNDQGLPFTIEIVDLNGDGEVDILCTNHQPDQVFVTDNVQGRVYALEQPEDGDIFSDWTTHVLLDGIDANPNLVDPVPSFGRLAPGAASAFYPFPGNRKQKGLRPWIALGGDEASKAWLLRPTGEDWTYDPILIFDVNDDLPDGYGEDTTQTEIDAMLGPVPTTLSISTIGEVVAMDSSEKNGDVLIYVPVFEAQDIHVFRLTSDCSNQEPV
ncbi:hypothetical protein ACHAXT_003852 [Thalassiosira profunda]